MSDAMTLTTTDYEREVLQADVPVLVDFYADWCMPCRMMSPVIEALSQQYVGRAKIFKVDVDDCPQLAQRYGISGIPALILFKNGHIETKFVGLRDGQELAAAIDRAIG